MKADTMGGDFFEDDDDQDTVYLPSAVQSTLTEGLKPSDVQTRIAEVARKNEGN